MNEMKNVMYPLKYWSTTKCKQYIYIYIFICKNIYGIYKWQCVAMDKQLVYLKWRMHRNGFSNDKNSFSLCIKITIHTVFDIKNPKTVLGSISGKDGLDVSQNHDNNTELLEIKHKHNYLMNVL